MKVLVVWRGVPVPNVASLARIFYFLKFNRACDVTLVAPLKSPTDTKYINELKRYCAIEPIKVTWDFRTHKKIMLSFKNRFSKENLFSRDLNIFGSVYFPKIRKKIIELLEQVNFDLVYVDRMMLTYVLKLPRKIPILGDFVDPVLYSRFQLYLYETKISRKFYWLLSYYSHKLFEAPKYKEIDAGIYITQRIKDLLKPYLPKKTFIVPNGVDTEYFRPNSINIGQDYFNLVFTGDMSYPFNVYSIVYFCNNIYPLIKEKEPRVKLFIVGRSPRKEVRSLSQKYDGVIVTGEVEDIRPFLAKAHVVLAPMIVDDGGFKTKILEAMAMGKPIVSTSIGVQGIDAIPEKNVIIADEPKVFADRVVELLRDEKLRKRMGVNARKFVEERYSWEKMTDILNNVFQQVVEKR